MLEQLEKDLLEILKNNIPEDDPAHDLNHTLRVLVNAKKIGVAENADLEIVVPAVIFHDFVTYPKNDPRNKNSVKESAEKANEYLNNLDYFPKEKIEQVVKAIKCTSFSFGLEAQTIEEKTVKDADMLEATGAIAIMRTFTTGGKMNRPLYNADDPFCENRPPDDFAYSVDLFFSRLLKIAERLSTDSAKEIAQERTQFLIQFLDQFKTEIGFE